MNTERKRAWSSKSLGSRFQHGIFYTILRVFGPYPAYLLLFFVVFWYVLRPSVRRNALYYLRRYFGAQGLFREFCACYKITLSFGQALLDRALLGICGRGLVQAGEEDKKHVQQLIKNGRGLFVLTAHMGCWQTGMAGLQFASRPVNIVQVRSTDDVDRHYFEHKNAKAAVNIIDPLGPFGGTLNMLEAAKAGEIVCLMGDRVLAQPDTAVSVDFLGGKIRCPLTPFVLAAAARVPILVLVVFRTGLGRSRVQILDSFEVHAGAGPREEWCLPYVRRYAAALERACQQEPFQFFNFFDMWI